MLSLCCICAICTANLRAPRLIGPSLSSLSDIWSVISSESSLLSLSEIRIGISEYDCTDMVSAIVLSAVSGFYCVLVIDHDIVRCSAICSWCVTTHRCDVDCAQYVSWRSSCDSPLRCHSRALALFRWAPVLPNLQICGRSNV